MFVVGPGGVVVGGVLEEVVVRRSVRASVKLTPLSACSSQTLCSWMYSGHEGLVELCAALQLMHFASVAVQSALICSVLEQKLHVGKLRQWVAVWRNLQHLRHRIGEGMYLSIA